MTKFALTILFINLRSLCLDLFLGLSVWPASILLGQWIARWGAGANTDMSNKMILELGAGCGLPALVAGEFLD